MEFMVPVDIRLKKYKNLALIAEYESVTKKYDFEEHSKYESTVSDSIWDIGKFDAQYEYINFRVSGTNVRVQVRIIMKIKK